MKKEYAKEPQDHFDKVLDLVMQNICPDCGSVLTEEETEPGEWTISCSHCSYVIVFGTGSGD